MLASLISALFIVTGIYAVTAMLETKHRYAGRWDELARQRRSLLAPEAAEPEAYPHTISVHCPEESVGAVVYQGCFMAKAGSFPLQSGLRAAA